MFDGSSLPFAENVLKTRRVVEFARERGVSVEGEIGTIGGCKLTAAMDGDKVTLTDENGTVANVTAADLPASNGVIDVIDTVLMPKM